MRIATLGALVALACLVLFGTPAFADDPPYGAGKQDSVVSPLLQQFIEQRESPAAQGASQQDSGEFTRSLSGGLTTKDALAAAAAPSKSVASDDPVRFDSSGNVQVYIHLENTDDDTLQELRDLGADIEIANSDANVVQAWVLTQALADIAALDAVREITAPDYGQTKAGRIVTEGDGIHRADLVRAFSGLSGRGVKVGAISDGVDARGTAQSSNDLPDSIEIDPDNPGSDDEGTALLEIIHDLVPSAQLAFSGPETSLDMVESILWLANEAFDGEGADIIVDDVGYYTEPYFEDGLIALAAEDAVAGGVVFTSAAGNNAVSHYTGQFIDGGDDYHDFDDSSETDIALRVALGLMLHLQWNDQFGSSGNDYDLFVCPPGLKPVKFNLQNDVCEKSDREQDGDDNPYESIYTSSLDYSTADVYIRQLSGNPRQLKLFVTHGEVLEHGVTEGGIIGHPAVTGVLAVGAIAAAEPGNDEPEFFSDRGQTEIYFPRATRNKPDVMGIDGVMITGSGGFGILNPVSPFSLFLGTSAAAPHVAGIAALVMEAQRKADPSMGKKAVADAVTQKLRDTAIDLGEQDSNGYSNVFGYGLADAWAAITSLAGASDTDALELYSLTSYADTHTVNSNGDGDDDDTTDGVCDDGTVDGSTNCTLRAAIQQTNAGTGATIKFNISGSGVQAISPASALPAITKAVFIDGYSQPGASAGTVLIEIDGTNAGSSVDGLMLQGNGNYVRGLAVNSFSRYGIEISSSRNNVLVGNMVGTDAAGSTDEGNGSSGVHISRSEDVLLRGNVISGNDRNGVETSNGGRLHFYGNKIGTNAAGTADVGNSGVGAYISTRQVVMQDNVISGNDNHGVHLKSNVTQDVVIENNRIGTNDAGTAALANVGSGIYFDSDPKNNLITGNIIGGNGFHGVRLSGTYVQYNLIAENWIGANASGADLGNGGSGVHISEGPDDNTVEDNVIAHNIGDGVTITGNNSLGNTIWENSIHDNDGHGIDLGDDGVTANDAGDGDSGPNHLQNYPGNLTFATRDDVASVRFTLDVTARHTYILDFYSCDSSTSGEGKDWLGFTSGVPSTSGVKTITASILLGQIGDFTAPDPSATHVTATTTDTDVGSTSEFAPCVARVALPELVISESTIEVTEGGTDTYTVALSTLPSAEVTVTISPVDTGVATVSDATLTFTTTNATTAQTITVTGASDDDADNEAMIIRHLVSIGDNDYLTAVVPVEVTDDDAPGLTFASTHTTATFPSDVSVGRTFDGDIGSADNPFDEGDTATYTIQLAIEPADDTDIRLSSSDTDAMTVSPGSITFTKTGEASDSNKYQWDDPQTVTLAAETDSDAKDEIEDVYHKVTIGSGNYTVGRVRAIIRDSGLPALTYTPDTREVTIASEGSTATYTIELGSEPGSDVTLILISSDAESVTVAPSAIRFAKTDEASHQDKYEWDDAQTVTVTGVADEDEFDDIAFIQHLTTFDGDLVYWASVQVTVTDGNRAPFFNDGLETTREIPENAGQGANAGAPVAATDLNSGDTLTYTLNDGSGLFSINSSTGQITVADTDPPVAQPFDYETGDLEYTMDVEVSDRTTDGLEDKIEVKVLVTNVNEPPIITRSDGDDALSYPEDTATTRVLHRYRATDPEKGSITWSVEGTDGGDFTIDTSGNLRFASQPDHETEGNPQHHHRRHRRRYTRAEGRTRSHRDCYQRRRAAGRYRS